MRKAGEENRIFHTTSPWLLEKLPTLGEKVESLEDGVSESGIGGLGLLAKGLSHGMAAYLDERVGILPYGIRMGDVLSLGMRRCLFPLLYKLFLLNRWLRLVQASSSPGLIVGADEPGSRGLALSRFATYYMVIAKEMALPDNVTTLQCPTRTRQFSSTGSGASGPAGRRERSPWSTTILSSSASSFGSIFSKRGPYSFRSAKGDFDCLHGRLRALGRGFLPPASRGVQPLEAEAEGGCSRPR